MFEVIFWIFVPMVLIDLEDKLMATNYGPTLVGLTTLFGVIYGLSCYA